MVNFIVNNNTLVLAMLIDLVILVLVLLVWCRWEYHFVSINNKVKNWFANNIATTIAYKSTMQGLNIPWINPKWEAFHKKFSVRAFRVIGGLSGILYYANKQNIISLPSIIPARLLLFISATFFCYVLALSVHHVYYIIKGILGGKTIYKN